MTLEDIKKEMIKRGCNKAQVESKTVPIVFEILSGYRGEDTLSGLMEELSVLRAKILNIREEISRRELEKAKIAQEKTIYDRFRNDNDKMEEEISRRAFLAYKHKIDDWNNYIDEFLSALNNCETKEGRDTLRKAQMFVDSVDVETSQNNTYFILGLAQILSGEGGFAISEIKKSKAKKVGTKDGRGVRSDGSIVGECTILGRL